MSYARTGLGFTSPGVNPLTGQPLQPGQTLVEGPLATGPRVSVVMVANPATWPRWVTPDARGYPEDTGTVAGGTWDGTGAQGLPDLVAMGVPGWVWLVAVALAYYLVFGKQRGRGEW